MDEEGRTCLAYAKAAANIAAAKSGNNTMGVSVQACKQLIELLLSYGCPDVSNVPGSGTLPRRRGSSQAMPTSFEKLPSSVI